MTIKIERMDDASVLYNDMSELRYHCNSGDILLNRHEQPCLYIYVSSDIRKEDAACYYILPLGCASLDDGQYGFPMRKAPPGATFKLTVEG
ncbi:hypothetical protein UFOVP730_51 [uncultured Caudovirales phage]|uniref:Uncharacterized protein n=1 Tax=uncultured Caudovirales phage TaxID=2100421 RepID=A0A6J5NRR2_9CAUD|nr:hypothetical protein UFOVP730_51 [uncultured Caudovirales phage]